QFIGTPTTGSKPLTVQFTDQSTGNPTSWSWTFGDGGTSSLQNPSHTYSRKGSFTVTLTATNANGSDSLTRSKYIVVTT
ncbi:MAG TPA: PKD domain-containing protein, partial [Methanoregulaceae archaeon]|nr:PKD domain-containing protein [Methanoregulaceae archaeon]